MKWNGNQIMNHDDGRGSDERAVGCILFRSCLVDRESRAYLYYVFILFRFCLTLGYNVYPFYLMH